MENLGAKTISGRKERRATIDFVKKISFELSENKVGGRMEEEGAGREEEDGKPEAIFREGGLLEEIR